MFPIRITTLVTEEFIKDFHGLFSYDEKDCVLS